jgi:hypothetical protein
MDRHTTGIGAGFDVARSRANRISIMIPVNQVEPSGPGMVKAGARG